jgi:ATP-dependent DNA helicase RecQ
LAKTYHYHILELKTSLQKLAKLGIVDYEASTNKPTIEFLINKVATKDFPLDQTQYTNRKTSLKDQLKACLNYLEEKSICRSIQLLDYLGEKNSTPCGVCDCCLSRTNKIIPQDYLDIRDTILINLESKIYTPIHKLLLLNKKYPELAVRKVLDRLLELNQIEKGQGEVFKKT